METLTNIGFLNQTIFRSNAKGHSLKNKQNNNLAHIKMKFIYKNI